MAHRFAAARVGAKTQIDTTATYEDQDSDHASLGSRILAYLVDTVALLGFAFVFFAAAGANIYLRSDAGRENPSEGAVNSSFAIMMVTIPAWLFVNLFFELRRGQTIGKYIAGLQVVRLDNRPAGLGRHVVHWLALHPLLFHPLIGLLLGAFATYSVAFAESPLVFFGGVTLALLCFIAPVASLFFALADPQRRGVHDWLAAMKVTGVD